jgi:chaperonin GroEL
MHATEAAIEEESCPGGSALLFALKALDRLNDGNRDQEVGVDIVRRAIEAPTRQIAENAGAEGSIVAGKLRDRNDENWGYDAAEDEYKDMIKAGIIDPTKVVRTALQDAASVAGLVVTMEAMVASKPELPAAPVMPPGGGMDF